MDHRLLMGEASARVKIVAIASPTAIAPSGMTD
jgi:hypothetical protein